MEEVQNYNLDGLVFTAEDVISFTSGMPGFEHLQRFVISSSAEHEPFHWLHCIDDPQIRFVLINPCLFRPDYDPKINREQIASLNLLTKEDILMYVIVTLHPDLRQSTANLLGPLFINIREKKGKQVIIDDSRYSIQEPLFKDGD